MSKFNLYRDITLDRTEDVYTVNKAVVVDEVEFIKIPGKKIEFDIKTEHIGSKSEPEVIQYVPSGNSYSEKNYNTVNAQLFSVSYLKTETDSSYIFQRTLKINPTHIEKSKLSKTYDDCVKINSIKNSSIIIQ